MHRPTNEKGYIALVLLLSLSVMILGMGSGFAVSKQSIWRVLTADAFQLNRELARLVHYAVDYVNLYGSGGSGPGHLPCPDTDEGNHRPGPNPPCGNDSAAKGTLPDGVTRPAGRIALSDTLANRSAYAVSSVLINNPSAVVNGVQWPEEQGFGVFSNGYALLMRPSGQARILRKSRLIAPTLRWVRAWLSWRLLEAPLSHCTRINAPVPLPIGRETSKRFAVCPQKGGDDSAARPHDDLIKTVCPNADSVDVDADFIFSPYCTLEAEQALVWLVGAERVYWQETRLYNHWFVKNRWYEALSIEIHTPCLERIVDCELRVDHLERSLAYRLLPMDPTLDDR